MENRKRLLIQQFSACFEETKWFVTIETVLKDITAEQALANVSPSTNSIWQIVNHVSFWNDQLLLRFENENVSETHITNDETFETGNGTEEEWQQAVDKLKNTMRNWIVALTHAEDEKLDSKVRSDSEHTWSETIANITLHNAYHIGQILHIRKSLGFWNPEQGVS